MALCRAVIARRLLLAMIFAITIKKHSAQLAVLEYTARITVAVCPVGQRQKRSVQREDEWENRRGKLTEQVLRTEDFDYNLPDELIAQEPMLPRDACRLLVMNREESRLEHRHFYDIGDYLDPGDLLVVNETRVLPARLQGKRADTGGAVEVLLLKELDKLTHTWECLVKPGKRIRTGAIIEFSETIEQSGADEGILDTSSSQDPRISISASCGVCRATPSSALSPLAGEVEEGGSWSHSAEEDAVSEPVLRRGRDRESLSSTVLLTGTVTKVGDEGIRHISFVAADGDFHEAIHKLGSLPLPPYIKDYAGDQSMYQTVYAGEDEHSAAAPTAGLHFTPELLQQLQDKGVNIARVRLDVGLDTFRPISEDDPTEHHIHTEYFHVPQKAADAVNATRAAGNKVVAVGTTVVRALESAAKLSGSAAIVEQGAPTSLYILPGFEFQVVDALITNFHVPKSTLVMMVSAFADEKNGREEILAAYNEAVQKEYRFLSFGDAMLIL